MSTMPLILEGWLTPDLSLIIMRTLSIILLFIISILLGILPTRVTTFKSNPKLIAFVNSFSAGLFLGLGMMHLLPESITDYNQYLQWDGLTHQFPIPFAISIISFSFVLFLERVIFQAHNFLHLHADEHKHHEGKSTSDLDDLQEALVLSPAIVSHCNQEKEEETFKKLISTKEKVARTSIDLEFHKKIEKKHHNKHTMVDSKASSASDHGHGSTVGPYAILTALSIHGMFEGIAVGIQTDPNRALNLIIAVLLHKWAEALTLGLALFKGKLKSKIIIIQILIFSSAGPVGIIIGWVISTSSLLVSAVFKAISAGTFLYVGATELVVEEFSISTNVYKKFLLYLLGLIFMGVIVETE